MTNKIKEITEEMKYFKEHYKDFKNVEVNLQYDGEQITQIYDYITNLQKELAFIKNDYKKVVNSNEDNIVIMHKAIEYVNSTDFICDEQYKKKERLENILKWW